MRKKADHLVLGGPSVTADLGFAYATRDADIDALGDGRPAYVLERWRPAAVRSDDWLRALPSRMLNARYEVVEFTGRTGTLDELRRWLTGDADLSVRWLHGPGGAGKTRVAAEVAAQATADGWLVVTATHGSGTVLSPPGVQDLRYDGQAGVLVIADYADRWPLRRLRQLLRNSLLHRRGVRSRVLLLARAPEAWQAAREIEPGRILDSSLHELGPLGEARDRDEMYRAAFDAFVRRYGLRAEAGLPLAPDDEGMDLVLGLHMAALVAVDCLATGAKRPTDYDGYTVHLLDRENTHWHTMYDEGRRAGSAGLAYTTPPPTMERAVYSAVLAGPLTSTAGAAILGRALPAGDAATVLRDHARCYPPEAGGDDQRLLPLVPDRLAEDFVALTLPGHRKGHPSRSWAPGIALDLLGDDEVAARAFAVVVPASARWRHVGAEHLFPVLRRRPDLARRGGGAAVLALADLFTLDDEILESVDALLPQSRDVEFDVAAAAVAVRLRPRRLAAAVDDEGRAAVHTAVARRLLAAGRAEEASSAAAEAWELLRELPPGDSGAEALLALESAQARCGRFEEALTTRGMLIELLRAQAADGTPEHRFNLGVALSEQGAELMRAGRLRAASALVTESIALHNGLIADDALEISTRLVGWNYNLCLVAAAVARWDLVVPAAERALLMARAFAENDRAEKTTLALMLNVAGIWFAEAGDEVRATAVARESVGVFRHLAGQNPAHEVELGQALHNLAARLVESGDPAEAFDTAQEVVGLRRRLSAQNPLAHRADLASSLNLLGSAFVRSGDGAGAVTVLQESVQTFRLTERSKAELAGALYNLAAACRITGELQPAREAAEESLKLYTDLAIHDPVMHRAGKARAYARLADVLQDLGPMDDCLEKTHLAVALWRQLTLEDPPRHRGSLVDALTDLATRCLAAGDHETALALARQTESLLQQGEPDGDRAERLTAVRAAISTSSGDIESAAPLVESLLRAAQASEADSAPTDRPSPAMANFLQAGLLSAAGRLEEALVSLRQAVAIGRERLRPDRIVEDEAQLLAISLNQAGGVLFDLGRPAEAIAPTREAIDILLPLAAAVPQRWTWLLAATTRDLVPRLVAAGDLEGAVAAGRDDVAVWRRLAESDPAQMFEVGRSLTTLGMALHQLGRTDEIVPVISEAEVLCRAGFEEREGSPEGRAERWLPLFRASWLLTTTLTEQRDARAVAAADRLLELVSMAAENARTEEFVGGPFLLFARASLATGLRLDDARNILGKAVQLFRPAEKSNPGAFANTLAQVAELDAEIEQRLREQGDR